MRRVGEEVMAASGTKVDYKVGTMIEVPRAALTAGSIAQVRGSVALTLRTCVMHACAVQHDRV